MANRVALLRIEDEEGNSHYVYIKHTDRLFNAHTHASDTHPYTNARTHARTNACVHVVHNMSNIHTNKHVAGGGAGTKAQDGV